MSIQSGKEFEGKPELSLVPTQALRDIAEVRMYGNAKYGEAESWRSVPARMYLDALYRHLLCVIDDPASVDEESGIAHYKHIACNAAFLCELLRVESDRKRSRGGSVCDGLYPPYSG